MAVMTLTGVPEGDAGDGGRAIARCGARFRRWPPSNGATSPASREPACGAAVDLAEPPYTHAETLRLASGRPVYWRAALRSPTTGASRIPSRTASKPTPATGRWCCSRRAAPSSPARPERGLRRLLEAAPAAPAAIVYQGDIGYPNNACDACYAAAPDYFADRFGRLLHQPEFARFRRSVPVGFTMDDHDYGPANNADRTTVEPWTWALWNRIHADPAPLGYFDFRVRRRPLPDPRRAPLLATR